MPASDRLIPLGIFGAPHGVRGELRVKSYAQDPKAIGAYGDLTDKAGARTFKFAALRLLKDDMLVVRLAGMGSREEAEKLTGVELFARRAQLPPPSDDEFYHDDLVGLEALTREGEMLGRVIALRNFGAGDILEIAPAAGGETLLLPFTKAVAVEVDFDKGRIIIVPPHEIEGEPRQEER
ncbi:ribosome maturation factor RimM [Methylocapsa sp. S129]|uniref:ribosome maturation factor RimM n=1 Tax=Methylocapsa sp. S129 TaxID=1641869 RepID=UPI001FEF0488|nr:ribosome maturation factor RimM [Methylocapsa sp. S129]